MSNNIVFLPGVVGAAPAERAACEEICERLRALLAEAEAGKVRALAYTFIDRAGNSFNGWELAQNERVGHSLVASVAYLHHEIIREKVSVDPAIAERPV